MKKKHQKTARTFAFEHSSAAEATLLAAPGSPFTYEYRAVSQKAANAQVSNLAKTGRLMFTVPAYSWPIIKKLQSEGKQFTIEHWPDGRVLVAVPKGVPTKAEVLTSLYNYVLRNKPGSLAQAIRGLSANCVRDAKTVQTVSGQELATQLLVLSDLRRRVENSLGEHKDERAFLWLSAGVAPRDMSQERLHEWRLLWVERLIREAREQA